MNHKAIVIRQLSEQRAKLQAECDRLSTAIVALGGDISSSPVRRKRTAKATGPAKPRTARKSAANAPDVAASIPGYADMTPIQKARAVRSARAAARKQPEGAILSEAATAG